MTRIAVLGASGFIGGRAVEMLHLQALADVRPVVRSAARLARAARFDLDARVADAFDESALRAAFAGCDVVLHAVAGDRRTILCTLSPVHAAARAAGVRRLVYLSSAAVHGQAPAPGTDERSPLGTRQSLPYNDARVRAERRLRRLHRAGGLEMVMLRPGIVYGPRSQWTAGFADDLLAGRAYVVDGGRGVCNAIYVDNLVHAIHLAATAPAAEVDGEAFLVGDRERITWAELYEPIACALGFGMADVHDVAYGGRGRDWWQRLNEAKDSRAGRAVLSRFPTRLRDAVYAGLAAWHDPPRRQATSAASPLAAGSPAPPPPPAPSLEMALLHGCTYKLPSDKAEARLGYAPPVSFAEACRRSIGWLEFAGYPVVEPRAAAAGVVAAAADRVGAAPARADAAPALAGGTPGANAAPGRSAAPLGPIPAGAPDPAAIHARRD